MRKEKLIVVLGPTSSGKSDLAVKLARKFDGEIVSADSRQVYRGMNLGTGKVTRKEMRGIPHHLLDVCHPRRRFDVSTYQNLAIEAIQKIQRRNKLPFLCGGTGFYIQAVVDRLEIPKVKPDWQLRQKLEKKPARDLYRLLRHLDPRRASQIDRHNPRRLIRAIEIVTKSRKPVPVLKPGSCSDQVLILGLKRNFPSLAKRIKKRLLLRLKKGLVAEVKRLKASGLSWKRLESFGLEYRWVSRYLQKKISRPEMIERLAKEIEHYAQRQMTWFRRDKRIVWLPQSNPAPKAIRLVKSFLINR